MADLTSGLAGLLDVTLEQSGERVRATWADGSRVLFCAEGDRIHFLDLEARTPGRLTELVSKLPAFYRARGITTFTTSISSPESVAWIEAVGFQPGESCYECDIAEGGRMDQYAAWKRGEADEPGWHRE